MSMLFAHLRSYGRGTVSKHMSNLDEMKKAKIHTTFYQGDKFYDLFI